MLNFLKKHLSAKTIFIFLSVKLLFWSMGMILFDARFIVANPFFFLGDYALTKYLMLLASIVGLHNIFLWRNKPIFIILNLFYCFLWTYVLIGYLFNTGFQGALVFRNLSELLFLIYMMYGIHFDKDLYDPNSKNSGVGSFSSYIDKWEASKN